MHRKKGLKSGPFMAAVRSVSSIGTITSKIINCIKKNYNVSIPVLDYYGCYSLLKKNPCKIYFGFKRCQKGSKSGLFLPIKKMLRKLVANNVKRSHECYLMLLFKNYNTLLLRLASRVCRSLHTARTAFCVSVWSLLLIYCRRCFRIGAQ